MEVHDSGHEPRAGSTIGLQEILIVHFSAETPHIDCWHGGIRLLDHAVHEAEGRLWINMMTSVTGI